MKTGHIRIFFITASCVLALAACGTAKEKAKSAKKGSEPVARLTLLPEQPIQKNQPTSILAKLTHNKGLYALNDEDLEVVHTRSFHLLVIDPTLTDYQHIHPEPTQTPGLYSFKFTPKMAGGYRAWADITPKETGKQEFIRADIGTPGSLKINKTESFEANAGGYRFTLSFDHALESKEEAMGTIHVTTAAGAPVTSLEPVMGAFGHIVGFYDDFRTVVHTHPMGSEPQSDSERGGADLTFHIEPEKPGFIKLFAQVKIDGKELFVPFAVNVAKR